ncbi:MAG: hypothetical protein ACI4TK_17825 [Agathobacter sp.]
MKLKLIKDNEIVVDKYDYSVLTRIENRVSSAYRAIISGVNPEFYKSIDVETDNVFVVMSIDEFTIRIKCFDSDDFQYNLLCANELVELLNQEQ